MAYETLCNSSLLKPVNKPDYTPKRTLKKAIKVLRKFFQKSSSTLGEQKHQHFINDESLLAALPSEYKSRPSMQYVPMNSQEESENLENERLEAAVLAALG